VNPSWLASNADRERTVGVLRAGFTEGRLTQEELDERVALAYAARTYADLWALAADLPAGPVPYPTGLPYQGPGPYEGALSYPQGADAATAGSWQSGAALLITALVIFTLAALVTAILTAHGQAAPLTQTPQFQHVNLVPFTQPIKG
jgi:hypothetical protein